MRASWRAVWPAAARGSSTESELESWRARRTVPGIVVSPRSITMPARLQAAAAATLAALSLAAASAVRADAVTDWNQRAIETLAAEQVPATLATRNLAIVHTAVFE